MKTALPVVSESGNDGCNVGGTDVRVTMLNNRTERVIGSCCNEAGDFDAQREYNVWRVRCSMPTVTYG
jgi:hypothetical protein